MAAENGQLERMKYIHCLLCNVSKPLKGFLSHIRQKHLNYHRYKCTECMFESDNEEESALHSFEKNHCMKFDNASYQEHLAVKVFQDCCREQFAVRRGREKQEASVLWNTNKRKNWNSCADIEKINSRKSRVETNGVCLSNLLEHEVSLQSMPESIRNDKIATNSTKCLNDAEKSLSDIHTTEILSKAAVGNNEPCELLRPDGQTHCNLGLFSSTLENVKTIDSEKFINATTIGNVVSNHGKLSGSGVRDPEKQAAENISVTYVTTLKPNTACHKCGKDVGSDYITQKTHALQFHFTQEDDPEIAELLPSAIKACFPHSLSWSDFQCTECGKALGTYGSRRNHVLKEHFYWSTICPLSGCTVAIDAVNSLKEHLKSEHNISKLKIPRGLKQKLRKMESDRKTELHRQLIRCFPCSLPPKRQVTSKESAYDSRHLPRPSITSIISSLLHSEPVDNVKRKNIVYSSSDSGSSSVEDDISEVKGEEHGLDEKDASASDSHIICHNFYNHEEIGGTEVDEKRNIRSRCFENKE